MKKILDMLRRLAEFVLPHDGDTFVYADVLIDQDF